MDRKETCSQIIKDLHALEAVTQNKYALQENIHFFTAVRKGLFSYLSWLFSRAPKLDGSRLLELTDYPIQKWDDLMHRTLILQERKKFPGLIEPIVSKIFTFIQSENRPLLLINFGAGAMEIERQVLERLRQIKHDKPVVFIGFDKSKMSKKLATENLDADFVDDVGELSSEALNRYIKEGKTTVLLAENDIFTLHTLFKDKHPDAVYHSLFRHHLDSVQKKQLDDLLPLISRTVFEYDGFRNLAQAIPQTIVGWSNPVFLNAEIFSNLRYESKRSIIERALANKVQFTAIGNYLLEFNYKI